MRYAIPYTTTLYHSLDRMPRRAAKSISYYTSTLLHYYTTLLVASHASSASGCHGVLTKPSLFDVWQKLRVCPTVSRAIVRVLSAGNHRFVDSGKLFNGVADTGTVVKMSILALGVYLPLAPVLAWLWSPYGLLILNIPCNAATSWTPSSFIEVQYTT